MNRKILQILSAVMTGVLVISTAITPLAAHASGNFEKLKNSNMVEYYGDYDPVNYPYKTINAGFTTEAIHIDGVLEEAYTSGDVSKIENVKMEAGYGLEQEPTYGELRTVWDGPVLYLGINVYDECVLTSEDTKKGAVSNPAVAGIETTEFIQWGDFFFPITTSKETCDSVAIAVDLYNDRTTYETDTAGIITIDALGNAYYFRNSNIPSLGSPLGDPLHPEYMNIIKGYAAAPLMDEGGEQIGYTIEMGLQIEGAGPENGTQIGLDIKINDVNDIVTGYTTETIPNPDYIEPVKEEVNEEKIVGEPQEEVQEEIPAEPTEEVQEETPAEPTEKLQEEIPAEPTEKLQEEIPAEPTEKLQEETLVPTNVSTESQMVEKVVTVELDPVYTQPEGGLVQTIEKQDMPVEPLVTEPTDTPQPPTEPEVTEPTDTPQPPTELEVTEPTDTPQPPTEPEVTEPTDTPQSPTDTPVITPTIEVQTPLEETKKSANIFWSHNQDSLYTDFNHEHANSVDWGVVTLSGWNGEDEFAYSEWRITKILDFIETIAFQKGVYTDESQAAFDAAVEQAKAVVDNSEKDRNTTLSVAEGLEDAFEGLRWADTRYPDPAELEKQNTLPNPYKFFGSDKVVKNNEDWKARREEILDLAQFYEYGYKPEYDNLTIKNTEVHKEGDIKYRWSQSKQDWVENGFYTSSSISITTTVTVGSVSKDITFDVTMPTDAQLEASGHAGEKLPIILSFDGNIDSYSNAGIAQIAVPAVVSDTRTDDYAWNNRTGIFYELYPYSRNGKEALNEVSNEMASAWAASVIIDALELCNSSEEQVYKDAVADLAVDKLAVTGFSINGKYAFVSAVFDDRIDVCIPGAAGATGPSPWRYVYRGQIYDWEGTAYTNSEVASMQVAWGTEVLANSIRHNRVREIELFRHFLTPGHFYAFEDGAYGYATRLPYDQSDLIATLAPRAIIIENTVNDYNDGCVSDCLGAEIAMSVYNNLGYDATDLVKFNLRGLKTGDPHGSDSTQRNRSAEYLNYYFFGKEMSEDTASYLATDPFSLNISNGRTDTPYNYYWGGYNTITGGTGGVDGKDGWYYYTFPEKESVVPDTNTGSTSGSTSDSSSNNGSSSEGASSGNSSSGDSSSNRDNTVNNQTETTAVVNGQTGAVPVTGRTDTTVTDEKENDDEPIMEEAADESTDVQEEVDIEDEKTPLTAGVEDDADSKADDTDAKADSDVEENAEGNGFSTFIIVVIVVAILALVGAGVVMIKNKRKE